MKIKIFKWFKYLLILTLLVISANSFVLAYSNLSLEEKNIFKTANNLGEISYYITDLLSNNKIMGLSILDEKVKYLYSIVNRQAEINKQLNLPESKAKYPEKILKLLEESYDKLNYKQEKMIQVQKMFNLYSEEIRADVNKLYGPKYAWLFDIGVVASFTKSSMASEYPNKLILLQFAYLNEYVPYELPTSVINSISTVTNVKEADMSAAQVNMLRESSQNIINYFNNPESYSPPATIKDIVGKWEGRLSDPEGMYHRAVLTVRTDLAGILDVQDMFNNMPISSVNITQSIVSFNIKPFADEKLMIKFTGRISDDMMTGEAVDLSGKKGLWQFLKTAGINVNEKDFLSISNQPGCFEKLIGVWKGKILEEDGAISDSTLYFNLAGDSVLVIDTGNTKKSLKVNSIAANDKVVKFSIKPDVNSDIDITFLGNIKERTLEGNVVASDGSRGYWKLVKISEPENSSKSETGLKINYSNYNADYLYLCDPILSDLETQSIIFVSNKTNKKSSSKLVDAEYKGYLIFDDDTKADITLNISNNTGKLLLSSDNDKTVLPLDLYELVITDREISFKSKMNDSDNVDVLFKGRIFGDYISGKAINSAGKDLKWELIAVSKAKSLLQDKKETDYTKISGKWEGKANFFDIVELPVTINIEKNSKYIKIADKQPLTITNLDVNGDLISFIVSKNNDIRPYFVFNGKKENGNLIGKITTIDGMGLSTNLHFEKPSKENLIVGIWKGKLYSGRSKADIVFDFTSDKKKVYIDDPGAEAGRLELDIDIFNSTENNIKFNAVTPKSKAAIEFYGNVVDGKLEGSVQNQMADSNKLSWKASKSNLTSYIPQKIALNKEETQKNKTQKTFSFLDEITITDLKDKTNIISSNNLKTNDITNKKAEKTELKNLTDNPKKTEKIALTNTDEQKHNKKESAKKPLDNTAQSNEIKLLKDPVDKDKKTIKNKTLDKTSQADVDKVKQEKKSDLESKSEVKKPEVEKETSKAKSKPLNNEAKISAKKQKDVDSRDSIKSDKSKVKKEKSVKPETKEIDSGKSTATWPKDLSEELKKPVNEKIPGDDNVVITPKGIFTVEKQEQTKQNEPKLNDNGLNDKQKETIVDENDVIILEKDDKNIAAVQEISDISHKAVKYPEEFLGKWQGEVISPDNQKGEIVLEIKQDECFIYTNRDGENIVMKLFEFKIKDKEITFKLKPSPDVDYGITFKGSIDKGFISGVAIDPKGEEGKWSVKRF